MGAEGRGGVFTVGTAAPRAALRPGSTWGCLQGRLALSPLLLLLLRDAREEAVGCRQRLCKHVRTEDSSESVSIRALLTPGGWWLTSPDPEKSVACFMGQNLYL